MNRIRYQMAVAAVAVVAVVAIVIGIVAVASDDSPDVYEPAAYPAAAGVTYCPYLYTPAEIVDCVGTPYAIPATWATVRPSVVDVVAMTVWNHYLTYGPSYYHTDFYYRRNIVQHAHYTTINITTFEHSGRAFDTRYAADEKRFTPKFKDSKGRVVTGSKYGQLNNKVVKKLPAGGNKPAGGVKDPGKPAVVKPPVTKPRTVTNSRPRVTSGRK